MRGKTRAPINPMILGPADRVLCTRLIPSELTDLWRLCPFGAKGWKHQLWTAEDLD